MSTLTVRLPDDTHERLKESRHDLLEVHGHVHRLLVEVASPSSGVSPRVPESGAGGPDGRLCNKRPSG